MLSSNDELIGLYKSVLREFHSLRGKRERLKLLREVANFTFRELTKLQRQQLRTKFNKRTKKWILVEGKCKVCGEKAECRHHIIPLSRGGHNHKKNVMLLCNQCHSEIHPWLKK